MKRLTRIILTIAFVIYPSVCFSAYLIELKNGKKFITYQYWQEGDQIKFSFYGGVVGIQKDLVREIRESDLAYREVIDEPYVPEATEVQAEAKEESVPGARETHPPDPAILEEKRRLTAEINKAAAAFREAKAKKDRKQMQAERKKLLSLHAELSRLRKQVEINGGQVPAWWDEQPPAR